MLSAFDTQNIALPNRSKRWEEIISTTYFPLELEFKQPQHFNGALTIWQLGPISLSLLSSESLLYRRTKQHLFKEGDENYLITIPIESEINFSQCGREVNCKPGGFILERSDEPYVFNYPHRNSLWVLKVKANTLRSRIREPDRFATLQFDAESSVGALFVDMIKLVPARYPVLDQEAKDVLGNQLIDLLVLSLKSDERSLGSNQSSVREAHLSRIESYIRNNLADPLLDPDQIANACGFSLRYLHALFRDTNQSVSQWIRCQRLEQCKQTLLEVNTPLSIAEVAYRWGFNDQAQFSRLFKQAFGLTPRDYRKHNTN